MKNKEVAENNSQLIQYMVSPEEAFAVCQKEQSILLSQQAAINEAIKTHLHSLTRFISYLEGSIHKAPEGFLRIHTKRNLTNYYFYHPKERGCGQYLPFQSNEKLIRGLCQKSYDQKLLSAAKHALVSLQKYPVCIGICLAIGKKKTRANTNLPHLRSLQQQTERVQCDQLERRAVEDPAALVPAWLFIGRAQSGLLSGRLPGLL